MFCFILVIIFIFIYLIVQKDNRTSSKFLAATLIAYIIAIFSMILYLSKDTYYYNVVNNYFSLPKIVWKYLMFINISKDIIQRLLNLSTLAVIFFGYSFSTSYQVKTMLNIWRNIRRIVLIVLLFQLIMYDPFVQYQLYMFCYPKYVSLGQITAIKEIFHGVTVIINIGIILFSILELFYTYKKVYFLHFLRSYFIGEVVCYTLIMISYIIIFWFSPMFLIKISKIANYVSYLSVPLSSNQFIYSAFPYFLLITTLLCAFCVYEIASIKRKIKNKEFSISKQIDAADTTSKIFCHYMKNELLAIQTQIEGLQITTENEVEIQDVLGRCNNLYNRLNIIHRSTKTSQLNLVETDMTMLVNNMIKHMKSDFQNCLVTTQIDSDIPLVMIDSNYFEQAIKNIIENALDSMETIPLLQRKITIGLQYISNWVILSIEDTGIGMSENNRKKIFTPFYSSKPITKHWGVGLALTHKIIMAHEGKLEVESHENKGTNFKIFLPDINKYMA